MRSSHRSAKAGRSQRARLVMISAVAAFSLILGQAFAALAGVASDPRGGGDGTTSDTKVVQNSGGATGSKGSSGSAGSTRPVSAAPVAGGSNVQVKFFGQDPTTYSHITGAGGNSSDATETELEAQDFQCGDKVAYYVLLQAPSGLAGSNTITVNLNFSKHTSSNEPFGFSSGISFGLEGGGVSSRDGGESTAGSGGFGSTADDITLSFQVSDVEASEVIPVRIVLVLGNCGPGKFTGNVASSISSCSPAGITTCGSQTVTLKFKGTLGTVRVVKDLNPSADPGTFNLRIGGTTFATGGDGTDTGALGYLAGTYTVDETGAGGTNLGDYTTTISCQNGAQPPVVTNGTTTDVTLANGDAWVCTISNTLKPPAAPQLTIIKTVVNNDGGTAVSSDFTMQVTATNPSSNNFPGADTPGVTITLDAGNYSVAESGPTGYKASFSADCTGTIAAGDHKTCTITNADIAPHVIVIKHVINNSGTGTNVAADFTMNVTGTKVNPASSPGAEAPGTKVDINAGAYNVTETGPGGYTQSSSADCTGTIAIGETKTCTITNDDIARAAAPQLTIIKTVVNNDGGTAVSSDFTMQVTATNPSSNNFPGADTPGVTITLDAGNYSVAESGPTGYKASFSADCTGTIAAGDHKTCTITNDDIAPPPPPPPPPNASIVIVKGGPAVAHVGDTITYTFAVSLGAGSPPLTNVTVVDPICNTAPIVQSKTGGNLDSTLENGETWNYTCTHVVTATDPDPLPNTATASGTAPNGTTVSDQDSHVVDLIHPAIDIVKSAKPQHGSPGDTIVYTYKVTNVGDVDLVNISVDDNVIGHICDIPVLHPKDSKTCTASFVIPANANIKIDNVGVAVGEDESGVSVRDEDTARITVVLGATITPTKSPPAGVAFTGTAAVVPLTGVALVLLLLGSGLLWAGRKRGKNALESGQ